MSSVNNAMGAEWRQSLFTRWLVFSGAFSVLMGLFVLAGWYLKIPTMIQVLPRFVPMQYNTALGFVLCGSALLLFVTKHPRHALALSSVAALIGFLTLTEYLFDWNAGLDELFMKHYITVATPHPGRMAPNTALCFFLFGLSMLALFLQRQHQTWGVMSGLLGGLVLVLGAIAFVGYVIGLKSAYGWGHLTHMAVHTALGFCVLGLAVLIQSWRLDYASDLPDWLPWLAGLVTMAITVGLWQAQSEHHHQGLHEEAHLLSRVAAAQLEARIASLEERLSNIARHWSYFGGTPEDFWRADTQNLVAYFPGLKAVEWVDSTFRVRWVEPEAGNEAVLHLDLGELASRRVDMEQARDQHRVVVTSGHALQQGGTGFYLLVPIYREGHFLGFILGVVDAKPLFESSLAHVDERFSCYMYDGHGLELCHRTHRGERIHCVQHAEVVLPGGKHWQVRVMPTDGLAHAHTKTLRWTLVVGGLFSLLSCFTVYLGIKAAKRARIIESQRLHLEDEVKARTAELKRSNIELEQFAYVASHDLQEPLRMVASFTQLLESRYSEKLDERGLKYMHFIVDGAVRMQCLINDLLLFSRVSTRGREFSPVTMDEVLKETLMNVSVSAEKAGASITSEPLPVVVADYSQMVQLLQNLISNALKFRGEAAPEIHISGKDSGAEWTFSVADNGIGIDPKYAGKIFQIFQRLHTHAEYSGTGIGLAVCKRIVERHGGKIWFESGAERGTTMFFTLSKKGTAS